MPLHMLNKINDSAAVKVIPSKVFYLSLTRHRGRKVISHLTSTELLCLTGCSQESVLNYGGWAEPVCELGAAVAEGTRHKRSWPEIWGFSSGTQWPDVQTGWESGKIKLNSLVWGMMQQANFSEENRNFKYQGTEIEGIRKILALITYTIRNLC